MNNVKAFFDVARPGNIISIRTDDWIGKIIRWTTSSNTNHVGMYIGNKLMIESTLWYGVRILPVEIYLNDPKNEVRLSTPKQPFDAQKVIDFAYNFYGTKYDLFGQIGIFVKYMAKKVGINKIIVFWGKNKTGDGAFGEYAEWVVDVTPEELTTVHVGSGVSGGIGGSGTFSGGDGGDAGSGLVILAW